jgi:hypothetical protein
MPSDPTKRPDEQGGRIPDDAGVDKSAPLWKWLGKAQPTEKPESSQPPRPRSLSEAIAVDKKARPATKKESRGRTLLSFCGVIIGLLLVLRIMAPILFPSEYEVLSESPKIIVPEIGGVKIGDSLADARQHMKFLLDGDDKKTTGSGYKTIPITGTGEEIWVTYWFLDSKIVDIELHFPAYKFDMLVDLLSEKFGERPYAVQRKRDGHVTEYWATARGDYNRSDYVLTRPPLDFKNSETLTGHGYMLGNGDSMSTVQFREYAEQNEQTKADLKKQL